PVRRRQRARGLPTAPRALSVPGRPSRPTPGGPLWISAGETSGDQRASEFLAALRAVREAPAFGIAGPRLRADGGEAVADSEALQVMGIAEVLRSLPALRRVLTKAVAACAERRPALAVLVDYGEFHMRLGARLRALDIPV